MATVLESLAAPSRISSSLHPPLTPITASASSLPSRSLRSPKLSALKVRPSTSSRSHFFGSVSRQASKPSRGRTIVCEAQETAVDVPPVNDAEWQSLVLESVSPVLVEFWAPWCGPCRMIHPIIDELARQYTGKLKCYKVNTDECPSIATQYGIRSIPTVIIFKNGEKKDAVIGAVPKSTLTTSIERFL